MKHKQDYIQDITQIRSIMERSTRFLSLSGWAGIMAGVYALAGAAVAFRIFNFNPQTVFDASLSVGDLSQPLINVFLVAITVLLLATGTAIYLSNRRAVKRNETLWNPTSRRLLINMSVPMIAGGLLILILVTHGLTGLIAPTTLIFYGISLYIASKFTYDDIKVLGIVEIILGLISAYFIGYGLLLWSLGFGVAHIIYGMYVHYKYEK